MHVHNPDGRGRPARGEVVIIAGHEYELSVRPLADHAAGRLPDGPMWMNIDGHAVGLRPAEPARTYGVVG